MICSAGALRQELSSTSRSGGLERFFNLGGMPGRGFKQRADVSPGRGQRGLQRFGKFFIDVIGRSAAFGKQVQPLVIPVKQDLLGRTLEAGDMDMDGLGLADAIQPADTLFQQIRV